MDALAKLRERMAELSDLGALEMLSHWDQCVMMPSEGGVSRAHQLATLERLAHERGTAEEIGGWLGEIDESALGGVDADLVRIARRDWERARRVPVELAAERAEASASGQEMWQRARSEDDFAAFTPALGAT